MLYRAIVKQFSTDALKVFNNAVTHEFTIYYKGKEAVLGYEKQGNKITYTNVNVPAELEGQGIAKKLAQHAFQYALDNKLDVTCQCVYLEHFFKKNMDQYEALNIDFDIKDNKHKEEPN